MKTKKKLFQSRTKRNFEITFPDDFAVGDFDDKDLEVYFLAKDEKHFQGINTDEEGVFISFYFFKELNLITIIFSWMFLLNSFKNHSK